MNEIGDRAATPLVDTLQSEMRLIRDAVLMVASGGSSRVIVAGLSFGEALLGPAQVLAHEHGVRVEPQFSADEVGASVVVVRAGVAERP